MPRQTRTAARRAATLTDTLRAVGEERAAPPAEGRDSKRAPTGREALARRLWEQALAGDLAAMRLVLEYTEGKPVRRVAGTVTARLEFAPLTDAELRRGAQELAAWLAGRPAGSVRPSTSSQGAGEQGEGERG
jgi:hypothetical protein